AGGRPRRLDRARDRAPGPLRRPHRGHRRRHRRRPRAPQRGAPRAGGGRLKLQVGTVLLQWAVGGRFFAWVTTRRREVGVGYGWTVRITYVAMALAGAGLGRRLEAGGAAALVRDLGAVGVAAGAGWALWLSFARRRAGVAGE